MSPPGAASGHLPAKPPLTRHREKPHGRIAVGLGYVGMILPKDHFLLLIFSQFLSISFSAFSEVFLAVLY